MAFFYKTVGVYHWQNWQLSKWRLSKIVISWTCMLQLIIKMLWIYCVHQGDTLRDCRASLADEERKKEVNSTFTAIWFRIICKGNQMHASREMSFCNIWRLWSVQAIPTYRVYRLHDKAVFHGVKTSCVLWSCYRCDNIETGTGKLLIVCG